MSAIKFYRQLSPLVSSEEIIEIKQIEEKVSLIDLIKKNDNIVLLGEPGSGKSFELDNLFKDTWKNKESSQLFPFFITLKKYHSSCSFEDLIPLKEWVKLPNILFILDGLDETAYPHDFISVLEVFINKHRNKNLKFVISSRTNIYINHQLKLDSFKPYKLEPLELDQINKIIRHEGIFDVVLNQDFIDKHPFYTNPFFLIALIKYYKDKEMWLDTENEIWEYYVDFELNQYRLKQLKKRNVIIPQEKKNLKKVSLINELQGSNQINEDTLFKILDENYLSFVDNPFLQKQFEQDKTYSFIHRQYQEYFAAVVLKELSFEELKSVILIENLNKVRPGLYNIISIILSLAGSDLFDKLSQFLIENNIEIILKSDSLRIPRGTKDSIFKAYFTNQCIEKTLWIGTNSTISHVDLAQFADSTLSFNFLLEVIRNKDLNHRARISAINLIEEFKSIDEALLLKTIDQILDSDANLSFMSAALRLINVTSIDKRIEFLQSVIDRYPDESNKEWNRSLIAILAELENIDEFFDYLQREFKWANNIIPRAEKDEVRRGNSWLMMELILRLNNEANFIELATFYFDDYHLRTREPFRENLIIKCLEFENKSPGFIIKLLEKIQQGAKIRSHLNDEALTELIKRSNKELDAFKIIYNEESMNDIDSMTLAKITTQDTIDYFVSIIKSEEAIKVRLQVYRNLIANYGNRDLAIYLETQLKSKGINIEDNVPTEEEVKETQRKLALDVQENANLLFNIDDLIKKIETTLDQTGSDNINSQVVRKIERNFYDEKKNWFRGLGCEFDILYAATHLYNFLTLEELKNKLLESRWIHLTALKGMLESNKGAQFKFELSPEQIEIIKGWIQKTSKDFDFNDLLFSESFESFTINRLSDYRFLKNFYYFFELELFTESFSQEFLLDSVLFYKIEEFEPFSEDFKNLLEKIHNKVDLKEKVIQSIKSKPISSSMEKLVVFALNRGYTEVYEEIEEFLEMSTHSPGDKLFDLYVKKNRDSAIKTIEKIAKDLSIYKGWAALKELSSIEFESKHEYCIKRSLDYLNSGQTEYKSNAMAILFKLNHPDALKYFIDGIGQNPLYNIANKYRSEYYVAFELFMENFDNMFLPIYQTKEVKDEFDRDWEFSENNTFFTQLMTNVLKHASSTVTAYEGIRTKLNEVRKGSSDDRIIFFSNSISELLTNNYINLMSKPMSFEEALKLSNQVIN